MSRILLLLLCLMCFSPALHAQGEPPKIACYASKEDNMPHKKKLWDGYENSLGPLADPQEVEYRCTAAIYNRAGRVVFRTSGFNVVFDEELTGEDSMGTASPKSFFRRTLAEETTAAGAISSILFHRSRTSSLKSQWKARWTLRRTKTGRW